MSRASLKNKYIYECNDIIAKLIIKRGDLLSMTVAATTYLMNTTFSLSQNKSVDEEGLHLITRCIEGETQAFHEMYYTYRSNIFSIVTKMLSDEADREEVTQEVFLQVFRSVEKFKGKSKLRTWIYKIAINVVLQHIRKKKTRIQLYFSDKSFETQEDIGTQSSPEDNAILLERQAAITRTLNKLSPKKRAVFVLHDFEGIPTNDVAKIVNTSVLTVRTRLFYARKDFYGRLAKEPACADMQQEKK